MTDYNHNNFILWLMGPTSSGKTTLAEQVVPVLRSKSLPVIHFDGDEVRNFFGPEHGFSSHDRLRVVEILVHLANKSFESGMNVIVSALTANQDARDYITRNIDKVTIGYVKCDLEECIKRDPKGLYKKAVTGNIDTLIGYNVPYMPPKRIDFCVDTSKKSIPSCTEYIVSFLNEHNKSQLRY